MDESSYAKQQPLEFAKMLADALWQALEADPSLDADEDWELVDEDWEFVDVGGGG